MEMVIVMCRDLLLMADLPQILQDGRREQWLAAAPNLSPAGIRQLSSSQSFPFLSLPLVDWTLELFFSFLVTMIRVISVTKRFKCLLPPPCPSLQARQPC